MIDTLGKYTPFLTLGAILIAYSYHTGLYSQFHIDILSYLSISDLLLTLLTTSLFIIPLLGIYTIIATEYHKPLDERLFKFKSLRMPVIGLIWSSSSLISFVVSYWFLFTTPFAGLSWVLLFASIATYLSWIHIVFLVTKEKPYRNNLVLVLLVLAFALAANSFGYSRAKELKLYGNSLSTSFVYHSAQVKTSKEVIYIGQTPTHLFLYDKISTSTLVFETSEIDSLRFK